MKVSVKKKTTSQDVLINDLKIQLARSLADYDNLKRRVDAERTDLLKVASAKVVAKLLPILDNLENVQKHLSDQGLAISIIEFKKVISDEGFREFVPKMGDDFNEEVMEAVELVDGSPRGKIAEVVLPGWIGHDQVIRHVKVKVYGSE